MATGQMSNVLQHLNRAVRPDGGLTDGQLLERFLARRDEADFEALVRRHGPMVLGTCLRVLKNTHDAEDAFQATFLVLFRKAASLLPRAGVANWLYGVAYHTALKARAAARRRRAKEAQVRDMPGREPPTDAPAPDWRPLLDQELSRLPEKYREPVVLCDLEGKTRREAAAPLGVPEGTLSGRLTTARRMLARRLARRGVTLSAGALAAALSQAASARVPAPLVVSTVKAAALLAAGETAAGVISAKVAALTEGVLAAMSMTKAKATAAFVVVIGLMALGGGFAHRSLAGPAGPPEAAVEKGGGFVAFAQRPKRERPKEGTTAKGALLAVDDAKRTITITVFSRGEGQAEKTFPVAKDAKVLKDGAPVKLKDLKRGRATLELKDDKVVSISVVGATTQGAFFDAGKKTITLTIKTVRSGEKTATFTLAKAVKVTIGDKAATLQDLKEGAKVTLTFSADENHVIQVQQAK
jgi:RNA polymerase sigma factor (sigma-70 family)